MDIINNGNSCKVVYDIITKPWPFLGATTLGQDSTLHLHLKEKCHSFEDPNVHVLDREDRWSERVVRKAIFVQLEKPSLNQGCGAIMLSWKPSPGGFNPHTHQEPCDPKVSHETMVKDEHSRLIHTWAHVTIMVPAFNHILIFCDCLHPNWVKYLGFLHYPTPLLDI